MDRTALITEIRARVGSPSVTELSDAAIGYAIDSAVSQVSMLQPYYTYVNIDLLKGVSNYTLASTIIDVRGFWCVPTTKYTSGMEGFDLIVGASEQQHEYTGIKVFHSPSLVNILEEKWERIRSRRLHDWEFNASTKVLTVIPTPSKASKAICKGVIARTLSTIDPKFEAPFKDLITALSMETWSMKMSMIKSIPVGVGKIDYDTENAMKNTIALKKEAIRKLNSGGSAVVIG